MADSLSSISRISQDAHENETDETDETNVAYVALLTRHQADIHAFINSLLPGDPEVEDVLQRANIVLWNKREKFEENTNFKAWAFSIARWETRAWLTEKKRKDWLVFNDELTDRLAEQFQASASTNKDSNILHSLRHCLTKLSNSERFMIFNYYQADKSIAECAAIVKKTEGALRVSLFRIRAGLRRCIESHSTGKEATS